MKICFKAHFYTDGDYSFRKDRLDMLFEKDSSLYKGSTIRYFYEHEDEEISICLVADGNENACRWALRDLLEALMCSISTIKHWLVRDLYDLLEYFHKDLWKELNQEKSNKLSGNYDGTILTLKMEE